MPPAPSQAPHPDTGAKTLPHAGLAPGQRAQLQAALLGRRDELDRSVGQIQGGLSRVEHAAELLAQDGDDAPQRDADREVDLARNDAALRELGEVNQALARLDDPRFGQCEDCAEPIPFERLRIEPWVRRCVACQGRAEAR